jgi:type I restriction enzyme M protein
MESQARSRAEPLSLQHLLERLAGPQAGGSTAQTAAIDLAHPVPTGRYSAVIGPVPFGGVVDARNASVEVRALGRSRRAELLAIAWALLALQDGGRLALVVPESVLEGATQAHHALRQRLVEENALQAVIGLRASLFRPRTRAAILVATRGGTTERVGFHVLATARDVAELLARWPAQRETAGVPASFLVRREDIRPPYYPLGIERYRSLQPSTAIEPQPLALLQEIAALEAEILQGIRDLAGMLRK